MRADSETKSALREEPFVRSFRSAVRLRYPEHEAERAVIALIDTVTTHGPEIPEIPREPAASYNPRAARVGKLFLELASTKPNLTLLIAAVQSSCQSLIAEPDRDEQLPKEVLGCILLDNIRHAHLMSLSIGAKELLVERCEALAEALKPESPLAVKLSAAVDRYRRHWQNGKKGARLEREYID